MDKWGTNFDDQIACGGGNVAFGLGGNDWLYSVPGTGIFDQVLVGGAGDDTYTAFPNASTVILEKGGGYDVLNLAINAGSANTYAYTINRDLLMMGDYNTGCLVMIPDATDYAIEAINFLDVSFSFREFFDTVRYSIPNYGAYDNNTTYYLHTLANAYASAAELPGNIGHNQTLPPAPTPQPVPTPPTVVEIAVAQFFNEGQYLQNKAAALQAGGLNMTVEDTAAAIANAGMSTWEHYRMWGAFERNANGELGLDPGAGFDTSKYYDAKSAQSGTTPEQLAALMQSLGLDPVTHYALYGQAEGIQPQPVTAVGVDVPEWAVA